MPTKKVHDIQDITFTNEDLILQVDGKEYALRLTGISKILAGASAIERGKYEISPSGYGIHWPLIDEELSIDGLLDLHHTPSKPKETVSS
ncbi:MAG: DUF2442 domain-containing protein [Candidatus Marinimicrobia bacterium]|nr:DUF2442 domain-containing protein [Candidatus Neomarinimicrobiota bacterium]